MIIDYFIYTAISINLLLITATLLLALVRCIIYE